MKPKRKCCKSFKGEAQHINGCRHFVHDTSFYPMGKSFVDDMTNYRMLPIGLDGIDGIAMAVSALRFVRLRKRMGI